MRSLEETLQTIKKEHPKTYVTTCGLIYEDNTHWVSGTHVCHAGLSYNVPSKGGKIKYVFTKWQPKHSTLSDEGARRFAKWITNDSPYAKVFEEKDPDKIVNGFYLSSPDHPDNYLVAAHCATRFTSEGWCDGFSSTWDRLTALGADPTYAYIFSLCFKQNEENKVIRPFTGCDSHMGLSFTSYSVEKAKNFLRGKPIYLRDKFSKTLSYGSLDELWRATPSKYDNHSLMDLCKTFTTVKLHKHMSYNIFENKKPTKEGPIIKTDEELLYVFDQFKKAIGE